MRLRYLLILFAVFLYAASSVFGQPIDSDSFSVEVTETDNRITIDEFAHFEIKIRNDRSEPTEFHVTNLNFPTWDIRTEPIANPISLLINPHEQASIDILVDPLKIREIGTYAVHVSVGIQETDEYVDVPLKVIVLSTDTLIQGYVPTVLASVSIPEDIDPRQEVPIKVTLSNQNVINYEKLELRVDSLLFKKTFETTLGPKEERVLEFSASLDPLTPPQKDNLVITAHYYNRSIINPIAKEYSVTQYLEAVPQESQKGFLTTVLRYDLRSNNPAYTGTYEAPTTLLHSIFSSEKPNAEVLTKEGRRYFSWDLQFQGNDMQVMVKRNYVPLLVILVLIVTLFILYLVLRSPLIIIKESGNIVKKEGGISELSLIIHIRNRGQKKLDDIEVTDVAPSLVAVEREVSMGSLQPNKILKHEKKGHTIIKWNVHALEPSEERVLSYKIKSRLSILGNFNLPAATAVFKQDKKTMTGSSSVLQVKE